jgi:hypothetical protein
MQIEFQFYWENARTNMNRVMKLKPSGGCRIFLAAFVATLASVAQLFAAAVSHTWPAPADITYGDPLTSSQMNPVFYNQDTGAILSGNYLYNPQLNTVLHAGNAQVLEVTFIPAPNQGVATDAVSRQQLINVKKKTLHIFAPTLTAKYGDVQGVANTIPNAAAKQYDSFVNGDNQNNANAISGLPTFKLIVPNDGIANLNERPAGSTLVIDFDATPTSNDYEIVKHTGSLTIEKQNLIFSLRDAIKQYGATPVAADAVHNDIPSNEQGRFSLNNQGRGEGWRNNDQTKVRVDHVHGVTAQTAVGIYDITVVVQETTPGVLNNYIVILNPGKYEVAQRPVLLTTVDKDGNAAPNGAIAYGSAIPGIFAYYSIDTTQTFNLNIPTKGSAEATVAGLITSAFDVDVPGGVLKVGNYEIGYKDGSLNSNFSLVVDKFDLTVNKANLTIAASNRSKITSSALPAASQLQFTATGLVNGESLSSILTPYPPKLKYDNNVLGPLADNGVGLAVGNYPNAIVFDGAHTAENYNVTLVPGDVNVSLQPSLVNWAPSSQAMTYGDLFKADAHLSAASGTTVVSGGNTVTIGGTIVYSAKKLDEPNKDVVIDADLNAGEFLPAGTYNITATFTPDANQMQNLGVVFGQGTNTKTFVIGKKNLKVTANDQTRVFGDAGPFNANAITYAADFIAGENENNLITKPTVKDPTNAGSAVGDYTLTFNAGESHNYAFVYVNGKFTITKRPTAVDWAPEAAGADVAKHIKYGTPLGSTPNKNAVAQNGIEGTYTYTVVGGSISNPDDPRALQVPQTSVKVTFTPNSPNYATSEATRVLNIVRKDVTLAPDPIPLVFGDADEKLKKGDAPTNSAIKYLLSATPGATSSQFGFLAGDEIFVYWQSDAVSHSSVGEYFITGRIDDKSGRQKNYNINLISDAAHRISITKKGFTIAAQNASGAVKQNLNQNSLKVVFSGLVNEAAVLNGIPLTRDQILFAMVNDNINVTIDGNVVNKNNAGKPYAAMPLLGRVFNAAPNFEVVDYTDANNTVAKDYVFKINIPDGSITGNYNLDSNTPATYSTSKFTPDLVFVNNPLVITYGTTVTLKMLQDNVSVPGLPENLAADDGVGTFLFKLASSDTTNTAADLKPQAGEVNVLVTYTPHADHTQGYQPATETLKIQVNKATLDVWIGSNVPQFFYGDSVMDFLLAIRSQPDSVLRFGTLDGNGVLQRGFQFSDNFNSVFRVPGSVEPIVGLRSNPNIADSRLIPSHSPAQLFFGQAGLAKNYNIAPNPANINVLPRPITVKGMDKSIAFGETYQVMPEYVGIVPGDVLSSPGFAFLDGQVATSSLAVGPYPIYTLGAFDSRYQVTHGQGLLTVMPKQAIISVSNTTHAFDGNAKTVTVSTEPAGVATEIIWAGGAAPVNAGTHAFTVNVTDPNYTGTFTGSLVINPTQATVTISNLDAVYDGTPKSATVTVVPAGLSYEIKYNGNPNAPTAAGTYSVNVRITDPNSAGSGSALFKIGKAEATIALLGLSQVSNGSPRVVTTQTTPADLNTIVTYNGELNAPSAAGSYAVVATVSDSNYRGTQSGTLEVLPAATIAFSDLNKPYTGSSQTPTVTTTPAGLTVKLTYNKSPTAPTAAGTYEVVAVIEDAKYTGTAKANFRITKANATVQISNLLTNWKLPVAPTVQTTPAGLTTVVTYNGSVNLPTEPGDYEVVASIVDKNYSGSATATFTVGKSPQNITFPAIPNLTISGQPLLLILNATSDSGLPVNYTVTAGTATINGNVLTVTQPGSVVVTGQQLGNDRYLAAEEKVRSFQVSGTGVPLGAPQTTASLTDDGDVSLRVSGEPFATLSVYAADALTGEFKPVVKIGLDQNGQGNYNTPVEGAQRFFQVK